MIVRLEKVLEDLLKNGLIRKEVLLMGKNYDPIQGLPLWAVNILQEKHPEALETLLDYYDNQRDWEVDFNRCLNVYKDWIYCNNTYCTKNCCENKCNPAWIIE